MIKIIFSVFILIWGCSAFGSPDQSKKSCLSSVFVHKNPSEGHIFLIHVKNFSSGKIEIDCLQSRQVQFLKEKTRILLKGAWNLKRWRYDDGAKDIPPLSPLKAPSPQVLSTHPWIKPGWFWSLDEEGFSHQRGLYKSKIQGDIAPEVYLHLDHLEDYAHWSPSLFEGASSGVSKFSLPQTVVEIPKH